MDMTVVAQALNFMVVICILLLPILIFKKLNSLSKNFEKATNELTEIKKILEKNQPKEY